MPEPTEIICDDVNEAIDRYTTDLGYRLDMIVPADSPVSALLSRNGEVIRLMSEPPPLGGGMNESIPSSRPPAQAGGSDFVTGRAGMQYRDLIPGRLGGRLIASHIRLTKGGEVPDYVHYHKVDFQMIYCVKGSIKVVYEDQGGPIWLHPGDCVLQPPEIRHRVLWAEAGSEVVELGMPAVHETWVEHEITLPTAEVNPDRIFNGQRFVRHIAAEAAWQRTELPGFEARDTGISSATRGFADVKVLRAVPESPSALAVMTPSGRKFDFLFILRGQIRIELPEFGAIELFEGDGFVLDSDTIVKIHPMAGFEALKVSI